MASLKAIKDRIASVNSTMKITSAMKMIASAKLRKAQTAITSFLPYSVKLNQILTGLLAADNDFDSEYSKVREVKKVAIVAFSSNSSLCGSYNANIIKEFAAVYSEYKSLGKDNILVYPIGKKIATYVQKQNIQAQGNYEEMADKPLFQPVLDLSKELVQKFLDQEVDKIILVYTHFKSAGSQELTRSVYLPIDLSATQEDSTNTILPDYILEPSKDELLSQLIPKVLASNLFSALLDSQASEHAARSMAMQIATDNAQELVHELKIEYNKSRQAAITNQLLDIIGGASALEQ
ncbi:F0F1 ATP synthase subunit gamma [Dysgonomonas sp. 520]|uniref:F0F1 ATP synthase subunit gamma n=1 Tax=Dysgonomonas sp. 520 TaxID=2302931 RepID=UPI0013CF8FF3|nr:F0F1 ATP synthase subunit gamma [Dysgonomonas sp. 520]NDW10617.1 F0F1 ATP synthase subunit gamma [Dysgonomonas sp. 520]